MAEQKAETAIDQKEIAAILKKRKRVRRVILFSVMVFAAVFLPSTVLLSACMLPTFVAGLIDRHPQKVTAVTVGAMNIAASTPAFLELWERGHTLDIAVQMAMTPYVILCAYAGAGIGWMIHFNVTPFVAHIAARRNEKRIKEIVSRQDDLVRKWGENVKE